MTDERRERVKRFVKRQEDTIYQFPPDFTKEEMELSVRLIKDSAKDGLVPVIIMGKEALKQWQEAECDVSDDPVNMFYARSM